MNKFLAVAVFCFMPGMVVAQEVNGIERNTIYFEPVLNKNATFLPHPPGCPHRAFCACGAAYKVFGKPTRELWPARAWYRFKRSVAAHMKVGVKPHHVVVLDRPASGHKWWVYDYNSGGHKSRYHIISIIGFTIVDPKPS